MVISPRSPTQEQKPIEPEVEWAEIPIDRSGTNPASDSRVMLKFLRIFWRHRPKAILSFTIKPNIYGSIAARIAGIPCVPNITGLGTVFVRGGPLMNVVSWMYRFALSRAPVVFFQNADDRDLFISRRLVRANQARLLPGSGVDLRRFAAAPLPPGPAVFLLVARLLSDKGIREFAEAARTLRSQGLDFRSQILGPIDVGNPTAIRREEIERWVADGVVEYLGETDDVRPFMQKATAIVLPSYYKEGVPRSLLEGAAMGRPLISTTTAGCRDAVDHGSNGLLCAPRDPVALAQAMDQLISFDADQLAAMGAASRELAEQRFDEQLVINEYLAVLREIGLRPDRLGGNGGAATSAPNSGGPTC